MSKKRKTKREKIISSERRNKEKPIFEALSRTYSIQTSEKRATEAIQPTTTNTPLDRLVSIPQNIKKILIVSGIIFALNIILFVLLQVFSIKLGILGY